MQEMKNKAQQSQHRHDGKEKDSHRQEQVGTLFKELTCLDSADDAHKRDHMLLKEYMDESKSYVSELLYKVFHQKLEDQAKLLRI